MTDTPLPLALTEVPLEGEGFDRAFETPSGTRFRVRVRQSEVTAPQANAAPTKITIKITLALLDVDNAVQRLGPGYRIFDPHEVSINGAGMATPGLDVEALITHRIAECAAAAEQTIANQATVYEYLATWGVGGTVPNPLAAITNAPAQEVLP